MVVHKAGGNMRSFIRNSCNQESILNARVTDVLRAHDLYTPNSSVLCACSGGTDSLALLDVLMRLRAEGGPHVMCAHYEHGIRGGSSRADADAVAAYCAEHHIPCVIEAGDVPYYARAHKCSMETAARVCRYDFLHRVHIREQCDGIALAHHADDLAETVLMRILRGTGPAGLAAMRVWDGVHLRPFLFTARAEIEAYIREHNLRPCHDVTNDQQDIQRNRIRHALLPELRTYGNPAVDDALVRLSILSAEEDDYLAQLSAEELRRAVCRDGLSAAAVRALHPAMQRRVLRLFWAATTKEQDFSYHQEEQMRALLASRGTAQCSLPHGWTAVLRYDMLFLQHGACPTKQPQGDAEEIFLPLHCEYDIMTFKGRLFSLRRGIVMRADEWQKAVCGKAVYADAAELPPLVLRTRRPGDYMQLPIGCKKLKEIMINDKIPREVRDSIPVLAVAGSSEIFWMVGGRRSILAPVTEHSTVLAVEWEKENTTS